MLESFKRGDAPEHHDLQYFEMFGNRGIYHRGWSAVTKHRTPWLLFEQPPPFDDDVWSCTTAPTTSARPMTCPPNIRRCCISCNVCG